MDECDGHCEAHEMFDFLPFILQILKQIEEGNDREAANGVIQI
jgi:hypothetical protein